MQHIAAKANLCVANTCHKHTPSTRDAYVVVELDESIDGEEVGQRHAVLHEETDEVGLVVQEPLEHDVIQVLRL